MSLINKALKDLDQRKALAGGTLTSAISPTTAPPPRSLSRLFWVLFIVAISVSGIYFVLNTNGGSRGADQQTTPQRVLADTPPVTAVSSVMESKFVTLEVEDKMITSDLVSAASKMTSQAPPEDKTLPESEVVSGVSEKLAALLVNAQVAFKNDRLTVPKGNSALDYYRQALAQDVSSAEASKGLVAIANRYSVLMDQAVTEGNTKRMSFLLDRVGSANIDIRGVARFREILAQMQLAGQQNIEPNIFTVKDPGANNVLPVSIKKTWATRDKEIAIIERDRYAEGSKALAKETLVKFINVNPGAVRSRLVLFDFLMQEGNVGAAAVLANATELNIVIASYLQSRILVAENNLAAALLLMRSQPFSQLSNDVEQSKLDPLVYEQYTSLLAALYQNKKNHIEAFRKYQLLVSLDARNANYWLGYAVSADALNQTKQALKAYEHLLTVGGVDTNVVSYVRNRIDALHADQQKIVGAPVNP